MNTIIRLVSVFALFAALQGCRTQTYRSTTPNGTQTVDHSDVLGIVHDEVINDSEAAYRSCLTAHRNDDTSRGFNAEAYCFNRTEFGGSLMGSPYYGQYLGAFTSAWGTGYNGYGGYGPMGATIPPPAFGGGRWVMTPSGMRYIPGGTSTAQGTALDPLMAPAVVGMDAQRTGAVDATTIEQGQAIAAYPVQGSLSAPSARAVSRLSPDALADLQRRVDTMQRTVLRLSRAAHTGQ